jgi:hypothetical protein
MARSFCLSCMRLVINFIALSFMWSTLQWIHKVTMQRILCKIAEVGLYELKINQGSGTSGRMGLRSPFVPYSDLCAHVDPCLGPDP